MKTQKTFRLSKIALVLGVVTLGLNANAVYNIYKKDGLTLDINGQVDMQATKRDASLQILNDVDGFDWTRGMLNGVEVPFRDPVASTKGETDKKTRLSQNHGVSFIEFRGAQILPKDWRVTGNVGVGYSDANSLYLSNSSLSLDKKNIGAITLGRQYLHTNYVNRSGTDTPLDIFSSSALRLDYYGIKGLHASAYYSFAGINDVRKNDNEGIKSGYGASLSYHFPFAGKHGLRLGLGYTENRANPTLKPLLWTSDPTKYRPSDYGWIDNDLNRYAAKTQGLAGSLEYKVGKFLIATDFGQKKELMSSDVRTPLDTKKSDYVGAKLAFDINPVWQISAGYGVKKTTTTLKAGAEPLSLDLFSVNDAYSYVDGDERHLFDKAKTKESYIQTDYRLRPNVRLYGRYDTETTTYSLNNGGDYAKAKDDNARIGFVFSF